MRMKERRRVKRRLRIWTFRFEIGGFEWICAKGVLGLPPARIDAVCFKWHGRGLH